MFVCVAFCFLLLLGEFLGHFGLLLRHKPLAFRILPEGLATQCSGPLDWKESVAPASNLFGVC